MIRKLLAGAGVLVAGYALGSKFGYRAAVVDYVENDAKTIEQVADEIYDESEAVDFSEMDGEKVAEVVEEMREDNSRAFQ